MASLHFIYGSMNAGKSTALVQVAHNYTRNNRKVLILKPFIDTKSVDVHSRIGVSAPVDLHVEPTSDVFSFVMSKNEENDISCVLVDESQFLSPHQVDQLFRVSTCLRIPVMAYGLRTDFQTQVFPAAARLLALAQHIREITTVCFCGKKATLVGRQNTEGQYVKAGDQVVIDGDATYVPLCAVCYDELVGL